MLAQSREYNNAGVFCVYMNRLDDARILFKGALEVHLAYEKMKCDPTFVPSEPSLNFIQLADKSYHNIFSDTGSVLPSTDEQISQGSLTPHHRSHQTCHLSLIQNPWLIHESARAALFDQSSVLTSISIVFNLAIMEHLKDPASRNALKMYGFAFSLLQRSEQTTTDASTCSQRIAVDNQQECINLTTFSKAHCYAYILNNVGVWYFENGDANFAERNLRRALVYANSLGTDDGVLETIQGNLQWMQGHPTSPAA